MSKKGVIGLSLILLIVLMLAANDYALTKKIKEKDLPKKYRDFLDLVAYIILPEEKEVFLQLTNDRDRDLFIESFWKQRDPTPGTPQNEFKEEHIRRFNYANKFFSRNSPREGWRTDMGRFYIILGPPTSIERFEGTLGVYPTQVWYYYGDPAKGLPPHFAMVFFQRRGAGEYRLYDPLSDGPGALLVDSQGISPEDYEAFYEKIRELAPTLAEVSLTRIPGDFPYNFQPSPRNNILLADILKLPKKNINPSYATHFLEYKGMVSTEYMTNYIESTGTVAVIEDPFMGMPFVHFSVSPKKISLDYFKPKDQYFCNFTLSASLRQGKKILLQYQRNFPFYFNPDELPRIKSNGLAIEDSFPAIEGEFKLIVLLQNSIGKEFCVYEENIVVPGHSSSPRLSRPILAYKTQSYGQELHIPFKIFQEKYVIDPANTFSSQDTIRVVSQVSGLSQDLWSEGRVQVQIKGMKSHKAVEKTYTIFLKTYPYRQSIFVSKSILANDFVPDYYEMVLILENGQGKEVAKTKANFIISPMKAVSHPIAHSKALPLKNNFLYFFMQAQAYEKIGQLDKAEVAYQRGYRLNPEYPRGIVLYGHFLNKVKRFDDCLKIVEGLKNKEKFQFQYHFLRGQALMGKGLYGEAIVELEKGNSIYNSDTNLLNALGYCYFQSGQLQKSLNVLQASLKLNPRQKNIQSLITKIEAQLKEN